MAKELVIICKEKIYKENHNFYCDNVDMKSIPEGISNSTKVSVIAIKSKIKRFHKINLKKIETLIFLPRPSGIDFISTLSQ